MRSSKTILLAMSGPGQGLFRLQNTIDMGRGCCEQRKATGTVVARGRYEAAGDINSSRQTEEEEPGQPAEA